MDFEEIINTFFVKPVLNPELQGYNIVNTALYGGLLFIIAFLIVFPLLDRKGIKCNYKFMLALMPYILIGISLRAINSAELLAPLITKTINPLEIGYWTYTPGVWFLVFAVVVIGLFAGKYFERKGKDFNKTVAVVGIIAAIIPFAIVLMHFTAWIEFFETIMLIAIISFAVIFAFNRLTKSELLKDKLNQLALTGQVIDGASAALAVGFLGFGEQHPASAFVLSINPLLFIFVKIALILIILHYVEKEIKRENLKGFIKVFLVILGFATGGASVLKIGLI